MKPGDKVGPYTVAKIETGRISSSRSNLPEHPVNGELLLQQMTRCVQQQRDDTSVCAWAHRVADPLPTVREKVQALVDAFRTNARHSQRCPTDAEVLHSAAQVLFEDRSFDSDDVTVALGTACRALGIPIKIILASYKNRAFSHVYFAVQDEKGEWLKVDATSKLPVGEVIAGATEMETEVQS